MAKISNKEILQSYILTTAKYDFSVYEKRILYRIIEVNQSLLSGKKLNDRYEVNPTLFDSKQYVIPISAFLTSDNIKTDKNHSRIKKAFESLQKKIISFDDIENKKWRSAGIVFNVNMDYSRVDKVVFYVADFIYDALMNFSKGFRKYELKTAMQFESVYSMRFYELLSHQKKPINYSIDAIKEVFHIQDKYKNRPSDFINFVLNPAKEELDRCSPYTFHFEPLKTGRKITSIHFIPIYQPQFEDEELKRQKLNRKISNRWFITKNIEDYLKYNFEFTSKELNNNLTLFEDLYNILSEDSLLDFLVELRPITVHVENPKAYIIGALKKKVKEIKNKP